MGKHTFAATLIGVSFLSVVPCEGIAWADDPSPCFEISPREALIDEGVRIHLVNLKPSQRVTVRAVAMVSGIGVLRSQSEIVADLQGKADVAAPSDDEGRSGKAAPLRILWSMRPKSNGTAFVPTQGRLLDPLLVTLTATADGKEICTGALKRLLVSPEVLQTPVRDRGLAGTFFRPGCKERYPGVLVLGGSEGGLDEVRAALLASRGYAVLALAYFSYEHLPKSLVHIPLEYFETALMWLKDQESVQGNNLGVVGTSRGGELALLLGATFPQIKAVVAYAPSHVVWEGIPGGSEHGAELRAAWTYRGGPVPFMSEPLDPDQRKKALAPDSAVYTPLFVLRLKNADAAQRAAIQVENIQGPVLLVSGTADKLWPATHMADMAMKRLAEHKHLYPDKHLRYEDCGHNIWHPGLPVPPSRSKHPLGEVELELGGTPEGTAFAAWDSWHRVLQFLHENLSQKE